MKKITPHIFLFALLTLAGASGCRKLIEIEPPKYTLTEEKVFKDDSSAVTVLLSIYSRLAETSQEEELISTRCGMSADELSTTITGYFQFTNNAVQPDDFSITNLWNGLYAAIYQCNGLLQNIGSAPISEATRTRLSGEAKFLRAFCYFYLTNLWGDVPLLLTTDVRQTASAPRSAQANVYAQMIADLKEAQAALGPGYPGTEKIRANRHCATALLARTYLYRQQWTEAEAEAGKVIDAGVYTPLAAPGSVFLKSSREAILQWWKQNGNTALGALFIPVAGSAPSFQVAEGLRTSFESNDTRKGAWIGTTTVSGQAYYYPFKYKQRVAATGSNGEYSVVLRVAEQYLVRAEARAQQGKVAEAVADLNIVRARSGLPALPATLTKSECLSAVEKERRIELAYEWGHRWLDLKRTGRAGEVLGTLKPTWKATAVLYPIPQQEINRNPGLVQNEGY